MQSTVWSDTNSACLWRQSWVEVLRHHEDEQGWMIQSLLMAASSLSSCPTPLMSNLIHFPFHPSLNSSALHPLLYENRCFSLSLLLAPLLSLRFQETSLAFAPIHIALDKLQNVNLSTSNSYSAQDCATWSTRTDNFFTGTRQGFCPERPCKEQKVSRFTLLFLHTQQLEWIR